MIARSRRIAKACALLLVFSLLHVYAGFALADAIRPQAITAKLTTRGNQAIMVNGNPTTSGATILSDSTIETGDQVGATINLGPLGSVEIAPNTQLKIEFSNGQIKITVVQGCLIVRVKEGTYGEVDTDKGKAISNDAIKREAAVFDVCYPPGAPSPIINQGAAANAGAGGVGGGAGSTEGVNRALIATLIGGGVGVGTLFLLLGSRGETTSASS